VFVEIHGAPDAVTAVANHNYKACLYDEIDTDAAGALRRMLQDGEIGYENQ